MEKWWISKRISFNDFKFFDKTSASGSGIQAMSNQQLANELDKPIIQNFKKEEFIHNLKTIFEVLI